MLYWLSKLHHITAAGVVRWPSFTLFNIPENLKTEKSPNNGWSLYSTYSRELQELQDLVLWTCMIVFTWLLTIKNPSLLMWNTCLTVFPQSLQLTSPWRRQIEASWFLQWPYPVNVISWNALEIHFIKLFFFLTLRAPLAQGEFIKVSSSSYLKIFLTKKVDSSTGRYTYLRRPNRWILVSRLDIWVPYREISQQEQVFGFRPETLSFRTDLMKSF